MKVYLQKEDQETELQVLHPDPEDGTFVVIVPGVEGWIRICPND